MSGDQHATDTMRLAREERTELAEFLATLTAERWDAPTLCESWRVRDVVAHRVDDREWAGGRGSGGGAAAGARGPPWRHR